MPKTQGSGDNKIYKPNPKPVPGGIKAAIGWDKDKFGDNRDLREAPKDG